MVRASRKQMLLEQVERGDPEIGHRVYTDRPALVDIAARRAFAADGDTSPAEPRSMPRVFEIDGFEYEVPDWLVTEDFVDDLWGAVKSGKEAEVFAVQRIGPTSDHLLAYKRYKEPMKRSFRRDQIYREGRKVRGSRNQKAVALGTSHGRKIISDQWWGGEFDIMRRAWIAGASVPFPVEMGAGMLMQFIGNEEQAAPRLVNAEVERDEAESLLEQVVDTIRILSATGIVHADLSAFNILVWEGKAWIIDFPQAVEISLNPHALDLMLRDIRNVFLYFQRKFGIKRDPEEEFSECLVEAYGWKR